ncbi:MAG: tetratricopeptide repeat protein [Acidobacteria bacterium]|nr:tetratricopeptide repeat protein [Acidobacteriota bacterium]
MRSHTKLIGIALVLVAALLVTGCNQLKARDQLNKGVQAYRTARYGEAIENFKRAIQLDPKLLNARLYLATAYAQQFMPGVESEDNLRNGKQAIAEFENVLKEDPNNLGSVQGIASIYFQMKKMDEAKKWYHRQIQLDPKNPESYYSVGVIDWTQTYQPRMEVKAREGLRADEPIKNAKVREELCAKNLPIIEEGFTMLKKAIELRPDYDDAMAYVNLMYREKGDCESSPAARAEDNKIADEWIQKTLEIKKKKGAAAAAK